MDLSSVIGPLLGVVVGAFLEPLKAWLTRIWELKGARREIYLELAQYFEDIKEAASGDAGYEFFEKAREKPPTFPVLDWYQSRRFDLLLSIDKKRGIRLLQHSMIEEYERINQKKLPSSVVERADDLLEKRQNDLDIKLLQGYRADISKNRSKSSTLAA